jgi:DNA-binding transcriptional regulator YhcF (GntR family)
MDSLSIDADSSVPPFEQLRVQFLALTQSGELAAGAKLPTVRALAEQLGLAAGTVARSYRELEALGIIETRGRAGSFVAASGDAGHRAAQLAARSYADSILRLGIDQDEALALVAAALRS